MKGNSRRWIMDEISNEGFLLTFSFFFFLLLIYPRCEKRNLLNFLFSGEWINEDEASEEMEMNSTRMMRLLMMDKLKMISIGGNWELFYVVKKARFLKNLNFWIKFHSRLPHSTTSKLIKDNKRETRNRQ